VCSEKGAPTTGVPTANPSFVRGGDKEIQPGEMRQNCLANAIQKRWRNCFTSLEGRQDGSGERRSQVLKERSSRAAGKKKVTGSSAIEGRIPRREEMAAVGARARGPEGRECRKKLYKKSRKRKTPASIPSPKGKIRPILRRFQEACDSIRVEQRTGRKKTWAAQSDNKLPINTEYLCLES